MHLVNRLIQWHRCWFCTALAAALLITPAILVAQARGRGEASAITGPWMNAALSPDQRADLLLQAMTLEEKLQLVHGVGGGLGGRGSSNASAAPPTVEMLERQLAASRSNGGAGFVPGIARLGIPDIQMADAAVGVTRGARALFHAASLDARPGEQLGREGGLRLRRAHRAGAVR